MGPFHFKFRQTPVGLWLVVPPGAKGPFLLSGFPLKARIHRKIGGSRALLDDIPARAVI